MALDNAEFISELSIGDPPGTDPLNQGDDHIRTTKKAVQQSFPNVGSAVPQTGAQMAQMAIKNEANTFTQINTFAVSGNRFTDLSVCSAQGTDPAGHHYEDEFGQRRWSVDMASVAGSRSFEIRRRDTSGNLLDTPISIDVSNGLVFLGDVGVRIPDGTSSAPGIAFAANSNTGMFRVTTNNIGFATSGTERLHIKNNGLEAISGQVGAPSYSFIGDNDTGMYRPLANQIAFAVGGVEKFKILTSAVRFADRIEGAANTLPGAPAYSFTGDSNTGMYNDTVDELKFAAGGVRRLMVKQNTVNLNLPSTNAGLSSGDCFISSGFVAIVP